MKPASRRLALPSEALAMYQRLRESRFHTGLLQGAAYDGEGDHDCAYDKHKKVLFLRLSAVELRDPQSPLWPALQTARLGPRLCRCMLRLLLPSPTEQNVRADVHWSPTAHTKLDHLRACMRAQHSRQNKANRSGWGPEQETLAMVDNAALGPARNVFHAYVENLVGKDPTALTTDEAARSSVEWDQAFYLTYAHSMCESPDHARPLVFHPPHWDSVNAQLSNEEAFHRAFDCRVGDQMRLDTTCSFWDPSH
ncbi:phosphate-regulating neutral endopeptidase PHEX-like [Haemaphysalis longicornis]